MIGQKQVFHMDIQLIDEIPMKEHKMITFFTDTTSVLLMHAYQVCDNHVNRFESS